MREVSGNDWKVSEVGQYWPRRSAVVMRENSVQDIEGQSTWHQLADRLCSEPGNDPAEVASRYCRAIGRNSRSDFDAALKNIRNWRSGRHVPRRHNARALATALGLADNADLKRRWDELLDEALKLEARQEPADDGNVPPEANAPPAPARWNRSAWMRRTALLSAFVGVFFLGAAAHATFPALMPDWSDGAAKAAAEKAGRVVGVVPYARMKVGESVVVIAARGSCGNEPPGWDALQAKLPKSLVAGELSDDGLGFSDSVTCGGLTPGRLIRFTGVRPGTDEFSLFGSRITMVVE